MFERFIDWFTCMTHEHRKANQDGFLVMRMRQWVLRSLNVNSKIIACNFCKDGLILIHREKINMSTTPAFAPNQTIETMDDYTLLATWEAKSKLLKALRDEEMELRRAVVARRFSEVKADQAGTFYVPLSNGFRLKLEQKLDYNLSNKEGETDNALESFSDDLASLLVSWKPTLSVSTYKKLSDTEQAKFTTSGALTVKPASPVVEIVAPKGK
jgi:hypothetical protein